MQPGRLASFRKNLRRAYIRARLLFSNPAELEAVEKFDFPGRKPALATYNPVTAAAAVAAILSTTYSESTQDESSDRALKVSMCFSNKMVVLCWSTAHWSKLKSGYLWKCAVRQPVVWPSLLHNSGTSPQPSFESSLEGDGTRTSSFKLEFLLWDREQFYRLRWRRGFALYFWAKKSSAGVFSLVLLFLFV